MMRRPSLSRTVACLVGETFRQSLAQGIFWMLLAVTTVCVLVCASASVENEAPLSRGHDAPDFLPRNDPDAADRDRAERSGVQVVSGELTLVFGSVRVPLARSARDAVRFVQLTLAGGVADTLGVLLCLVWTAGFLPGFLAPQSVAVLLAKPPARWRLLAGKCAGVSTFVLAHAALFVLGTWLALGWRTGVWDAAYLACVPLLVMQFAVFFSFSLVLAVATRNTVACVFGSLVFWIVCWGVNFGRHWLVAQSAGDSVGNWGGLLGSAVEWGYWLLPKPVDFGMMLFDSLEAGDAFGRPQVLDAVQELGAYHPALAVLSSLGFATAMFLVAANHFASTDY
jgi:hypothetical protein